MFSKRDAKGDGYGGAKVDRGDRYSRKGVESCWGKIGWFGKNLRAWLNSAGKPQQLTTGTYVGVRGVFCLYENCPSIGPGRG